MKISLNWIKEFVDIPAKYSAKKLAELLTLRTCEVESYEDQAVKFSNMVTGKVLTIRPHPGADKLRLVDTDIGGRTVQIVCGGENLYEGMFVAIALPGALVKWHGEGELVELKETKIRGELSHGMICAEEEINLPSYTPRKGITIADLSFHVEKQKSAQIKPGTMLAKILGLDDVIFEIDNKSITHRPDLWGHYGMAREFAAFLGKKLKPFVARTPVSKNASGVKVKVELADSKIAARFVTAIITGINVEESPQWMKRRLLAVGMRPVNNIVDVTNYVMHELGHPLHAFDRTIVNNDHFVIRYARKGEITETLDHKKRALHEEDALVTDGKTILGIAGVMGGLNSEINPQTKEIILEAACWNPIMLRKTSQRHGLRSDAAQRFEKSLDPEITGIAFHRTVELILQICSGAKLVGPVTDVYPRRAKEKSVMLDTALVSRKIGTHIAAPEIMKYLRALEFGVSLRGGRRPTKQSSRLLRYARNDVLKVTIPTFRATKDINIEDDLVEEIARMHGYEKIAPSLPSLPIKLPIVNRERTLKHETRDIFSLALGFTETNHYSFYGASELKKCLLPEEPHMRVANPLSEDQTHLRISLMPNILKSVALNQRYRDEFKLYEIGRTYIKGLEEKFIAGVVVKKSGEVFYNALGALKTFFELFQAPKMRSLKTENPAPYAHPSKCASMRARSASVSINQASSVQSQAASAPVMIIAEIFELHPLVLRNFDIKGAIAAFEINFTKLVALGQKERSYKPLPRFPGIEIDISVLVPKRTEIRSVFELIRGTEQNLIADVSHVETYEDKSLGQDKKSFTVRVLLQSPNRTLTDEEMKQIQQKIFDALVDRGFSIR